MRKSGGTYLFMMPSLYGLATFAPAGLLYFSDVFPYEPAVQELPLIYLTGCSFFLLSLLLFKPFYAASLVKQPNLERNGRENPSGRGLSFILAFFYGIGALGVVRYVLDFSEWTGGADRFFLILFSENTLAIRMIAEKTTSFGTQLTYPGWVATTLTVGLCRLKRLHCAWLLPAGLTFLANLLFIDRTRPLWLLVTTLLFLLSFQLSRMSLRQLIRNSLVTLLLCLGLFLLIGNSIGKVNVAGRFGPSWVPLPLQNSVFYATSGFSYLNRIIQDDEPAGFIPHRLIYPVAKLLNTAGLADPPPAQVLPFYYTPFGTNVGTFLEPFYRDGGWVYALLGMLVHSVGFDLLGLYLLRTNHLLASYFWANLCFTNLLSPFTPKITSFPLWFFAALFLVFRSGACFSIVRKKN